MSWDYKQVPYCLQEVWHSLIKWVRGESQKQRAPTTCDRHLNSFQHDISLNQAYKGLHCKTWCGLDWTRVIVLCNNSQKKARSGWSFHFSINGNSALSKFSAEIITKDEAQWVNSIMVKQRQCIGVWCLMDENYIQAKMINSYKQRENSTTGCLSVSCYYHNCLGLSFWSNQSTGLKILHKGESSALSSHILSRRPPACWGQITAYFTEE